MPMPMAIGSDHVTNDVTPNWYAMPAYPVNITAL